MESIIFDGLIKINEKGEPQPNLASSWEIRDGSLKWIFYLKKGVKFHDGVELTAEDVVFTYKAVKNPENKGNYASYFKLVKEIRVIDKYTIEITLQKPYASFLYGLGVGILPKHLLEGKDLHNTEFNYHPVGTGAYKFVPSPPLTPTLSQRERERGARGEGQSLPLKYLSGGEGGFSDEIVLKANEDYFNGRPYLNKIIIKNFPNQKIMWARLMRGEIDFSSGISPLDYEIIKSIPSFKTYSVLKPYYYMIAFNLNPSPLVAAGFSLRNNAPIKGAATKTMGILDKRVRQALNYAIDKEKIVREVLKGMGKVSAGTVYPLSWAYDYNIKPYSYNPQKALKLLKDAGWKDSNGNHILDKDGRELKFTVLINKGDEVKEKSMRLIQEQLLDVGVKLQIELIDLPFMSRRLIQKDFESAFIEIASINNPDINYQFWHSSRIKEGLNMFSYKNKRVDDMLDKGRATFDREKRKEYYIEFQKEMLDDPPGIFLFWTEYLVGVHERFEGIKVDWRGTFANIADWYVPAEKQRHKQ
ncbi:MAG: hypothetical protein HY097_04610 [Nitrospinae bacterium]|nr:hypothetical protein [Nitrospinota bacterium]